MPCLFSPLDLVAVTGDLVDSSIAKLRHAVEPIKHLKSKHGNFFITGRCSLLSRQSKVYIYTVS